MLLKEFEFMYPLSVWTICTESSGKCSYNSVSNVVRVTAICGMQTNPAGDMAAIHEDLLLDLVTG